jgi:ferredoxin
MALKILPDCINCDMCLPECPNEAISYTGKTYKIDVDLCTECVGFYDTKTCVSVCPIDCIITDPDNVETEEELKIKFINLTKND